MMKGKNFIMILFTFFIVFTISLFTYLYFGGWFDRFLSGGFKALY